jgi:hypothetical protein
LKLNPDVEAEGKDGSDSGPFFEKLNPVNEVENAGVVVGTVEFVMLADDDIDCDCGNVVVEVVDVDDATADEAKLFGCVLNVKFEVGAGVTVDAISFTTSSEISNWIISSLVMPYFCISDSEYFI